MWRRTPGLWASARVPRIARRRARVEMPARDEPGAAGRTTFDEECREIVRIVDVESEPGKAQDARREAAGVRGRQMRVERRLAESERQRIRRRERDAVRAEPRARWRQGRARRGRDGAHERVDFRRGDARDVAGYRREQGDAFLAGPRLPIGDRGGVAATLRLRHDGGAEAAG